MKGRKNDVMRNARGRWEVWFNGKRQLETFEHRHQGRSHLRDLRRHTEDIKSRPLETPSAA